MVDPYLDDRTVSPDDPIKNVMSDTYVKNDLFNYRTRRVTLKGNTILYAFIN